MSTRPLDPAGAAPNVRGECPSAHRPFAEVDGALLRIRVPGGVLAASSAGSIAAVADSVAAGPIELTSRANLQLRGVPPEEAAHVCDALVAARVTPNDAGADERRNVIASPTAGIDADELIDTRSLVVAIAERLASTMAGPISPKFGVLVDGGGSVHVRGKHHDVALGAVRCADGAIEYELALDAALPTDLVDADLWTIRPADVLDVFDTLLELCGPFGRVRTWIEGAGAPVVWDELSRRCSRSITARRRSEVTTRRGESALARGTGRHRRPGRSWIGAGTTLGRVDTATLAALATLADRYSGGDLRITPWRGFVLPDVREGDIATVLAACDDLGLSTDPSDPARRVVACAGSLGCAAGRADTQADAARVIDRLRGPRGSDTAISVHVSGCEKGCAQPAGSAISLVAAPGGTYDVYSGRPANGVAFGSLVCTGLEIDAAITAAVELTDL